MAQTTREQVVAFENDVKTYSTAVDKIVKQNDLDDGIAELTSLINRCEKEIDYSRMMLSSFYKGRGHGYFRKKEYSLSVSDYKKAISLLQKVGEEGRSEFSNTWYQLSLAYYYWGKPLETMNAADKCVESAESYYGSYHSNTLDAYSLRSNYEGFYNKGQEAMQDRKKCFEIIRSNVERNFTYLTASERAAYWEKYLPETTAMFAFAQKLNEQQSEFTDALFNQQLLAKGLLLTAESALQRAIDSDPNLYSAYQRIRSLRTKASDSKTNPKDAEAATLEADRIERGLGTAANSLHQFMDFLKVHSGDVKGKLGTDDVASAPKGEEAKRRGVAGLLFAYKTAGAAAENMENLENVTRIAQETCDRTRTMGVALTPCIVPEAGKATFSIGDEDMELGMGIHGEPGIERTTIKPIDEVVDIMLDKILTDMPIAAGEEVAVLVNGLGATPREELYLAYRRTHQILTDKGIRIHRKYMHRSVRQSACEPEIGACHKKSNEFYRRFFLPYYSPNLIIQFNTYNKDIGGFR